MQRALVLLSVGGVVLAALGSLDLVGATAGAVLPVDTAITAIRTSVVNVWIPTIALLALIALVINFFGGFVQIGGRAAGAVVGFSLLGAGLPWLNSFFGTQIGLGLAF
jgi:hypothetical protein